MKEEFAEFVKMGLQNGLVPPFRVVAFSNRKGIVEFEDSNGRKIEGRRILEKGVIKWSFKVISC